MTERVVERRPVPRVPPGPPDYARRRRVVFGTLGSLLVAAVVVPGLLGRHAPTFVAHEQPTTQTSAGGGPQPGCSLMVDGSSLALTDATAAALTDAAGHDQQAGLPTTSTAAAVARIWPLEAGQARSVAASLRGYVPGALSCTATVEPAPRQPLGASGLTARAEGVWVAVERVFGRLPAGGFAPGGVTTGHVVGSAHYEGRAIDYFYRPITAKTLRHGWVLAQWLVAHAQQLRIATVIFDRQIWMPADWAGHRWQPYTYPDGTTEDPTLLHYDHVHVDVVRGTPA